MFLNKALSPEMVLGASIVMVSIPKSEKVPLKVNSLDEILLLMTPVSSK